MVFDPSTFAISWLLGKAASEFWSFSFERNDARKRLSQSLKQWAKDLKEDGDFQNFAEVALFNALFSAEDTTNQEKVRNKLINETGVPDVDLICQALLDSWRQVHVRLGNKAQSFFLIDEDAAKQHLTKLAQLIYSSCFESAAQQESYDLTKKIADNINVIDAKLEELYREKPNNLNSTNVPHIEMPSFMHNETYTSHMTVTDEDVERVLILRRKHFGANVVSSDQSYWACWTREPDSIKLVRDENGKDVGYWAMFPVKKTVFHNFMKGNMTHEQLLTEHVLRWEDAIESEVFLYVVGAVVPCGNKYASGLVLLDMFRFGIEIISRMDVAGIFGYPSRDAGFEIFQSIGFAKSGVIIDEDDKQPIFYVPENDSHLAQVKHTLSLFVRKEFKRVPIWNEADRNRFLSRIS